MDQIDEQIVSEKVDHFFKHGNIFILSEIIHLRGEVKSLREEIQLLKQNKKQNSLHSLLIR